MQKYLYETHMHTSQGSACSSSLGRDYIKPYMDLGYAGIIITDHFFKGNTRPDRSLPWTEWVNQFCSGYEDAKNEGDKWGFPVFFGLEENFNGDEYLIYGIDKAFLLAHPDMKDWDRVRLYREVRNAGGCMVQAHPFRSRFYNDAIHLMPDFVDGIEAVNYGNVPVWNTLALQYAKRLNLPFSSGSDNHNAASMSVEKLGGVLLNQPLQSIQDYVSVILEKKPMQLKTPSLEILPPWENGLPIDLPVHIHGENNTLLPGDVRKLLEEGHF